MHFEFLLAETEETLLFLDCIFLKIDTIIFPSYIIALDDAQCAQDGYYVVIRGRLKIAVSSYISLRLKIFQLRFHS